MAAIEYRGEIAARQQLRESEKIISTLRLRIDTQTQLNEAYRTSLRAAHRTETALRQQLADAQQDISRLRCQLQQLQTATATPASTPAPATTHRSE